MRDGLWTKGLVVGIIGLFIGASVVPTIKLTKGYQLFTDDFSTDTGLWTYNTSCVNIFTGQSYKGGAYRDHTAENLVLTKNISYQAGVIWLNQDIFSPLTVEFRYKAGGGTGADGIAFMFYKQKAYIPYDGGGLGFVKPPGGPNSPTAVSGYGIEFDNYDDSILNDPPKNHIALLKNNVNNHLLSINDNRTEDNQWHNVVITVGYSSVELYVDSEKILTWEGTIDRTYGGLGFSGTTGADNNWHILDDVNIYTKEENQPPIFGTSTPVNGSTNRSLTLTWNIPINDTNGDPFAWTIQCSNGQRNNGAGASNGTKSLSLSGLVSSKRYKVWVNATDPTGSGLYTRKWYTFTTKKAMTVIITKPLENTLYIRNKPRMNLSNNTFIYGPITITANVTSDQRVAWVKFYVDRRLKKIDIAAPYTYVWNPIIQFKGLSLKHTIKVIAYDIKGTNASAELNVTKWRFHPLPLIIAGVAGVGVASPLFKHVSLLRHALQLFKHVSSIFKHTTVRGLFFNIQNTMFTTSFYALHIRYRTIGPFRNYGGFINFRRCTGGMIIGPSSLLEIGGPSHNIVYGTFTFLGNIDYYNGRFGQGFTNILQTR